MAVDIESAKAHLNLTTSDDDALVTRLIAVAQDWLESQLGYRLADEYPDEVPVALEHGIFLMVAHFYANREASLVGVSAAPLPLGICDIVNDYRRWSWSDDE